MLIIVLSLLYYLGFLTRKEMLPLSKEFLSAESSSTIEPVLDLKGVGVIKSKIAERKPPSFDQKELDQLYQIQLDKGVRNLSTLSLFLVREARKARESGQLDRAIDLATYAHRFSPELPQPYFELAKVRWKKKPFQLDEIFPEILKGYRAKFSYFPSSLFVFYNGVYILSNAILMAFIIFGIILLWKYFPIYLYDIRRNLTLEVPNLFINGLKIFILFIPFFLRFDILWAILYWNILLWGFVPSRERQIVLVFLLVLVFLPFVLRTSSASLNSPASEIVLELHESNYENWDKMTEEKLKSWLLNHPDDVQVLFTLGLIEKRQGRYTQAEDFYRRVIDYSPELSEAYSNLGNVYLAQKQIRMAVESYQRAVELNPNKGGYHFNLYRAYSQETFFSSKSEEAFQLARSIDPKLVRYYSSIDSPNNNRLVIDEILTHQQLWNRLLDVYTGGKGLLFQFFRVWFERIPSAIPFLSPIFFIAFLVGMSRYTRAKRFLTRCPICGNATHRLYLGPSTTSGKEFICFNCYRLYAQKEKVHPKLKEKKSLQVHAFQKQDHFMGTFPSYLFIGFSQLWRGHAFKGLLLLSIFFIIVLRFLFWHGVLPGLDLGVLFSWWSFFFWGGLFVLFWFLNFRWVRRLKPEFKVPR